MSNLMPAVYLFGPLILFFNGIPITLGIYALATDNWTPFFKFYGFLFGVKYE